ncbi:lytic transglycosylase domain-containing protein [Ktedonobacteria bacterium brp13]|nr:lytic transglycosylase domain-containing protein [Ktedonobacteria bacterium brp13]
MTQFRSLRSFGHPGEDDQSREDRQYIVGARETDAIPREGMFPATGMMPGEGLLPTGQFTPTGKLTPTAGMTPPSGFKLQTDHLPVTDHNQQIVPGQMMMPGQQTQVRVLQLRQTGQQRPVAMRIYDARSNTQSLVFALQSTMQTTGRAPLIIPADKKRTRPLTAEEERQHRLNPHVRHILAGAAALCILMFTMFSLTPLGSGQSGIAFFDGAANLVHINQPGWSLVGQNHVTQPQSTAQQPVQAVAAPTLSDGLGLPQSQYVAIAEQDATAYGISPVYFVRQIQQESGFNPYAYSPAGAVGIAQFEPGTAAGLGVNPYNPIDSLNGAARMMAGLSNQYGGNYAKALAAYNAGSGAVDNAVAAAGANWLALMPAETQNYVAIIMG